jgi:predicted dehydrogenase
MSTVNRRHFLATTASGAAVTILGTRASGRVLGANEAIRVGVVGLRGRGQLHIDMVSSIPGFRLAAVCDIDPAVLGRVSEKLAQGGRPVRGFKDLRDLIACQDLDAVTIATPNHWHALASIWACQAGKDVYVEKPVSHNLFEGRQLVQAARRYQRMVQVGLQARSNPDLIEAVAWVRAGNLGSIQHARGTCYKPRMSIGKEGTGQIPPGLDYDLWLGPAPKKPLTRKNLHYDWHWMYDYGNGDLGNQGVHEMDIGRWFLGQAAISPRVISVGGRLGYEDDGQTPNTQLVYHAYEGPPLLFEVRGLPKSKEFQASSGLWGQNMDTLDGFSRGRGVGVLVVCEGGRLAVVEGGETIVAVDRAGQTIRRFDQTHPQFGRGWSKGDQFHFRSWLDAIRTRDPARLTAESLEGHLSAALCHTGMISHRLGQPLPASGIREQVRDHALLAERFESFCDHLTRNGMNLEQTHATLGPWLAMDPIQERFLHNPAADALLSRPYREPFVVPQIE